MLLADALVEEELDGEVSASLVSEGVLVPGVYNSEISREVCEERLVD